MIGTLGGNNAFNVMSSKMNSSNALSNAATTEYYPQNYVPSSGLQIKITQLPMFMYLILQTFLTPCFVYMNIVITCVTPL